LVQESADLNTRAGAASGSLSAFLAAHEISDFEAEMNALSARAADIETQALDAAARQREAEARAASLRARSESEPEEIHLSSESDARRQLVDAQMEREQLLSRYQPDALPVREVDRRIAQLSTFLEAGDPASVTRRGVNPVRQDMLSQLYAMEAEARAQRGRGAALAQQRIEVRERLRRLEALEPQYRQLERERTIVETNAQSFAARAEEARARTQMLGRATDNITAVERALAPTQGKSLRWPIMIVTLLIAGLVACGAGFSRALMRRSFPTPSSAARTLETPVLAVIPSSPAPRMRPQLKVVEGGV